MPFSKAQRLEFEEAIRGYSFPARYWDFSMEVEQEKNSVTDLEPIIRAQLRSRRTTDVARGLANVIHWGNGKNGYRHHRRKTFLLNVHDSQIMAFQAAVARDRVPTLSDIKNMKMPQFSGVSFLSKILMFLNPVEYCVLDAQIADGLAGVGAKALHALKRSGTQLAVTPNNQRIYEAWRVECRIISSHYFGGKYRVVDIERAFFGLIQAGQKVRAQALYLGA
jgi:hypothetical protein